MGLESYLFYIEFDQHLGEEEVEVVLLNSGFSQTKKEDFSDLRSCYYEYCSDRGITEAHVLFLPGKTTAGRFSLRFSVASPPSVIDQTFELIEVVHTQTPVKIFDTEIEGYLYRRLRRAGSTDELFQGLPKENEELLRQQCYIPLSAEVFKKNNLGIEKRKVILKNSTSGSLRGGTETFDYVRKKGLKERLFGWIRKEI